MARAMPLHEGGTCRDLDVMVARTIDLRRAKSVGRVLGLLKAQTSGLIEPASVGDIVLPMFGGPLLKRAVLEKGKELRQSRRSKHDATVVSADKMDDVGAALLATHDFLPLTMKVANLGAPFDIDDKDNVVVRLDGASRQYQKDGKAILNAMCELAGGATQAEILATDFFRPPEIVVGHVNRHVLRFGEEQKRFAEDPNAYIHEQILDAQTLEDDDDPIRLFANKVVFSDPVVVAQPIMPNHMPIVAQAESPYDIDFDGLVAIKPTSEDWLDDQEIAS